MSQENVEIVRRGYEHFAATGDLPAEDPAPDFVWDMSKFRGWPEQQTYEGVEGARVFLRDWLEAWDDWELEVEAFHDSGDKVVAIVRQRGPVEDKRAAGGYGLRPGLDRPRWQVGADGNVCGPRSGSQSHGAVGARRRSRRPLLSLRDTLRGDVAGER
jgi:ketosteroid isomerase-like protein